MPSGGLASMFTSSSDAPPAEAPMQVVRPEQFDAVTAAALGTPARGS